MESGNLDLINEGIGEALIPVDERIGEALISVDERIGEAVISVDAIFETDKLKNFQVDELIGTAPDERVLKESFAEHAIIAGATPMVENGGFNALRSEDIVDSTEDESCPRKTGKRGIRWVVALINVSLVVRQCNVDFLLMLD